MRTRTTAHGSGCGYFYKTSSGVGTSVALFPAPHMETFFCHSTIPWVVAYVRLPAPLVAIMLVGVAILAVPQLGADPGAAATTHVHIQNTAFNPETVTVLTGETVEWDNHDAFAHTVTANGGLFHSGNLAQNQFFQFTFTAVGIIEYHCAIHSGQTGTIVVVDPQSLPDLVVTGIAEQDVVPGATKTLEVTVRNIGGGPAGASSTRVFYEYNGERKLIGEAETGILTAGASASVTVDWDTLGMVGDFRILAVADADGQVPEASEGNNSGEGVAAVLVSGIDGVSVPDELP
jgi:plastocyanin